MLNYGQNLMFQRVEVKAVYNGPEKNWLHGCKN